MIVIEGTIPIQPVRVEVDSEDFRQAIGVFKYRFPDARIETINGRVVRGVCACGRPIFEDERDYRYQAEGEGPGRYTCYHCLQGATS